MEDLLNRIALLPQDWHGAGTVGRNALYAIARHVKLIGGLRHSAETGSGKTTLLLSALSPQHTVFALDAGDSIRRVRESELFNAASTVFVEGPTQRTLPPTHVFTKKLSLALIDGPHGYPFPDLEYFYLYPQIETGGLLLVDDIQIPTIRNMFNVIKADPMFELLEIVDGNMAFSGGPPLPALTPLVIAGGCKGTTSRTTARS